MQFAVTAVATVVLLAGTGPRVEAIETEREVTVLVNELLFSGRSELLEENDRNALENFAVGARLGLGDILALADWMTMRLYEKGDLLARAYVPPQDITGGAIDIAIVEGRVEEIDFERSSGVRVSETLLRQLAERDIDSDRLTRSDLESALYRMEDLPGVSVRALLEPGTAPGTSRVTVRVDQDPRLKTKLMTTNHGSFATGRMQHTVAVTLTDLAGLGDETQFQGVFSQGTRLGQVRREAPVGTRADVFGHVHYAHLDYDVIDGADAAGLNGESREWEMGVSHALIRSRQANLRAEAGVAWQAMVDGSVAGVLARRRSVVGSIIVSGDRQDMIGGGGAIEWSLRLTQGNLDLSGVPANQAADSAGLKTAGVFQSIGATVTRTQQLHRSLSWVTSVSGQWAGKNLDASQEFTLGGPRRVRAYPVGEARGDEGILANMELRYRPMIFPMWGALEFKAFVDAGHIRIHKDPGPLPFSNACGCNAYALSGAGLGVNWKLRSTVIEVNWAHALGDNPGRSGVDGSNADGGRDRQALWISGSISF